MDSPLLDTWRTSHETNLFLLGKIPEDALASRYTPRTRTVASQFAHMHNVRLYQLQRRGKKHMGKLRPFPRGAEPSKSELRKALEASAKAMAGFLEAWDKGKSRIPSVKILGYIIAHEAHHRGLAMVALRLSDHKVPQEVAYSMWDWMKKK
ncbi:MAG: DinB family protein [Planctomycetota bacterium]|jgi:uncharacterized damage-inducible protein DinB